MNEREAVAILAQELNLAPEASPASASLELETAIGDDAAVLRFLSADTSMRRRLVWTIDHSAEGFHFQRQWLRLQDIGWKSFHAATSDIAAVGATPVAALCHLTLPASFSKSELRRLARGQGAAAKSLACSIVGGNLSRGVALELTTTVIGLAQAPLLRSGARPGHQLWLMGELGLARAGLLMLQRGGKAPTRGRLGRCIRAWRRPKALVGEGLALVGHAESAIDVSDGLGGDAAHLAEASGVRVVMNQGALLAGLAPALHAAADALGVSALEIAMQGGEDYALLATGFEHRRPQGAKVIGSIERGKGVVIAREGGSLRKPPPGFDHLGVSSHRRGA